MTAIAYLSDLVQTAKDKKAVVCPSARNFRRPMPAAFLVNMSGVIIDRLINEGLFIYEPKKKEKTHG